MRSLLALAPLALLGAAARGQELDPAWRCEPVEVGVPQNGCAVGDVDPTTPGNEVVAVGQDGAVHVLWRTETGWRRAVLARNGGELMQVAVGDLLPEVPGQEVAAVGVAHGREGGDAPGVLFVAYRDGEGWSGEVIARDPALLHMVCVDTVNHVWTGGSNAITAADLEAGAREHRHPFGQARAGAAARGGVAVVFRTGQVALVTDEVRELDRRDVGRARIAAHGDDLLVADDDGLLSLLPAEGPRVEVYRSKDKLRGAVLADLDPDTPGVEAATAGYDGQVVLLRRQGDAWRPALVGHDGARLHHLAAGELPGLGTALVGASLGGRVVVAFRAPRR